MLSTFVEMKSRFYIALPMKDRSKDSMLEAIKKLIKSLPKFACYKEIENMVINFCFADSYSVW